MIIKRRFPSFFEGFEETEHEVKTKEDLLAISWIKDYKTIPNHMGVYYCPRDQEKLPDLLMSLLHDESGEVIYLVVGYIFGNGADLGLEDYNNFI